MKEPDWKKCSEEELWRYVATHLKKNGIAAHKNLNSSELQSLLWHWL